jgi:hypothetical protein
MVRRRSVFLAVFILLLIVAADSLAQTAATPSGDGSAGNPYQIDSLPNLYWITQNAGSWGSYFVQTADIDASSDTSWNSGAGFTPIAYAGSGYTFTGHYDGGGHTISGLFISQGSNSEFGLFAVIDNAEIKNLGLINVNITGGYHLGGLAGGSSLSTIDNCYTTGVVFGNGDNVGGLIGATSGGVISNSHSTATVSGDNYVGGLVGANGSSGTGSGGNYGSSSSISNSYATGNVSGTNYYVGGLTGINSYYCQMTNCYSTGNVTGAQEVGGLVGENIGVNSIVTSSIDSCYSTGSVTGSSGVGGLTGQNEQSAVITNSYSSGNVKCTGNYSGGFTGSNNDLSSISNCSCTCIDSGADYAGGFAGACSNGAVITRCYSAGGAVGGNYVGGLAGQLEDAGGESHIYYSYSSDGVIASGSHVGGLVGDDYACQVSDCYSNGKVSGAGSSVGGLVGSNSFGGAPNSFWDTQTSGQSSSGIGSPATNAAMTTETTFSSSGWDFTNTWAIDATINNGYPGLLWQSQYVASAPVDTTYTSTNLDWSSATLHGLVMPHKSTAIAKFIYGTVSGTYPDTAVTSESPLNGWDGSSVSANISDLNSSTTYYYRVIASNSYGSTEGVELSFTTAAFVAVQPAGGGTSSGDPYHVDSLQNLYWITQNSSSWGSHFVQDANIDASTSIYWNSGAGFSPIGNESANFTGTYNGMGHTITGLLISASGSSEVGMFGFVANDTIENLELVKENVTGGSEVGGLVGLTTTSFIDSCSTSGSVTGGSGGYVGGLIGFNDSSSVNSCSSSDTVNDASGQDAGGLAGVSQLGSTFTNCFATGNVTANSIAGGLIGYNTPRSTIHECYATGNVTVSAGGESAGGLVGYNYQDCPVSESYSTGTVNGGQYGTGGLIGYNYSNCTITNCYCTGSASGSWEVGGLIGYNYSSVSYCYSTGAVTGTTYFGGLIGFNTSSTVTGSFWDTETSGQSGSAAGTAETDAAMKVEATFTNAGWDFVLETTNGTHDYWDMDSTDKVTNSGYPFLSWQNGGAVALPVEMASFSVTSSQLSANLQWKTATEVNINGFEIQRSAISLSSSNPQSTISTPQWSDIAFVEGHGTSSAPNSYSFVDRDLSAGTYSYRLKQIDNNGSVRYSKTVTIEVGNAPHVFTLSQNYPNPFNPTTTIEFTLPADGRVTLKVYDILGREVATLLDENRKAGEYQQVVFDASRYSSGVYFAVLQSGGTQLIRKMLMVK